MSIINGLHDQISPVFSKHIINDNQWIWDTRVPKFIPQIGSARSAELKNKRILMIGTDMAAGKMTVGLELYSYLIEKKINAGFVATGQVGITVTGKGIPLDAYKLDHACGAVETAVLEQKEKDIVIVEGQGSILHPGSTATLPLMRGTCEFDFNVNSLITGGDYKNELNLLALVSYNSKGNQYLILFERFDLENLEENTFKKYIIPLERAQIESIKIIDKKTFWVTSEDEGIGNPFMYKLKVK